MEATVQKTMWRALITAIKNTPEAKEIILVADNNSCIRDYVLLSYINRPVHVILMWNSELVSIINT